MNGYDALRSSAARFPLPGRGRIRVTGEDRVRLIHAMCTNNVEELAPGNGLYAFFLNAQGRVLADAHIFALADALLIDTEPATAQSLYEHIDKYVIADDVTLEDLTAVLTTTAVEGPQALQALARAGIPVPAEPYGIIDWSGGYVARLTRAATDGAWILTNEPAALDGVSQADADAVNVVRLENARPIYGIDFSDANIAQETRLMHALHFNKGCYLGQEIVERVRSRGHVNRMLAPLRIETTAVPERGAKILADGREAGEITSAAYSPAAAAVVALGFIRSETQKGALQVSGSPASATL